MLKYYYNTAQVVQSSESGHELMTVGEKKQKSKTKLDLNV